MRSLVRGAAVLGVVLVFLGLSTSGVALSPYDVLIVDDGHMLKDTSIGEKSSLDRHYARMYKNALLNNTNVPNVRIDFHNVSASGYGPSRDKMNNYDLVIWYTLGDIGGIPQTCPGTGSIGDDQPCTTLAGDENNVTFNGEIVAGGDIENITKYLRLDRGRLLLTGHRIAGELKESEFLNDVLYSNWTSNTVLYGDCNSEGTDCDGSTRVRNMPTQMTGQDAGPVVDGGSFVAQLNTTSEPSDWREVIYETRGDDGDTEGAGHVRENMIWEEPDGDNPGIDLDGDGRAEELAHSMIRASNESFKFVNLAMGLESMQDLADRKTFIRNAVNYLLGPRADATSVYDEYVKTKVGEAGTFQVSDSTWQNVTFANEYNTPVVIGTVNSEGSSEPLVVSVRNVHSTWAEMRVCEVEASNEDDKCVSHSPTPEEVGYLVVDASKTERIDGIEAGRFEIGDRIRSTNRTIQFTESMGSDPVMLGTLQTVNGEVPTVPRFIDTGSSFAAGICHSSTSDEDICEAGHANETVGWVALEQGNLPFFQQDAAGRLSVGGSGEWGNADFSSPFSSFDLENSFEDGSLSWSWNGYGTAEESNRCGSLDGGKALVMSGGDSNPDTFDAEVGSNPSIVTSPSVDLSGRTRVKISYDVLQGYDGGNCEDPGGTGGADEDFVVEYYTSGGTWKELSYHQADGGDPSTGKWEEYITTLPADALHSNFQVRFRARPSSVDADYWAVDDVELGTGPVALSELQTRNGGEELLTTRAIGATNELNAKFCENDGTGGCEGHLAETVGWAAVPAGTLTANLSGYPAYTNSEVTIGSSCIAFQDNPTLTVRNAKFFVEGLTGIPANHRLTTAGEGFNMTPTNPPYNSLYEEVVYRDFNASSQLSNTQPRGVNSTFAIQCQDSEQPFYYWGPFEKDWLVTDTTAPITGSGFDFTSANLEFGEQYTNRAVHNLTVKFGVLPRYNPDLVRFSCQQDGPWTNWRFYNHTQESQTYEFDLTAPLNGCRDADRNVTVHAQIRDFANNTASQIATDWIVLDRNDPTIHSLEPQNRYINLTDLIRINGTDDRALSVGLEAPNNTFSTDALYDGFEDGNDDKWTAQYDCRWGVRSDNDNSIGQYSVELGDGSSHIMRSLDISDLQDVKVTYYGDTDSMDNSGENGYAEWWDGDSWHTLETHHNDPFEKHVEDIPSSWIDSDGNNRIRFRIAASGCGDHFDVDEIKVQNQVNGTFLANASFDPGYNYSFEESGSTQLTSWLFDRASNFVQNTFNLFVDVRNPSVDAITQNASYIRPEKNISVNVSDDQSFGFLKLNNGTHTSIFTSTSVSYEPDWNQEIWTNLTLRMNDSAGNPRVQHYWYFIDGTPPILDGISASNNSFINDSILTVNASDARAGLGTLYQYNGNRNETFTAGHSFDADWSGEGVRPLTVFLFDKAGNLFKQYYEFTLDTTDPSASINYTWPPSGHVNGWIGHDLAVGINATDNFQTDRIRYCVGASTCTTDKLSGQGLNVSTTVSCPAGSTCTKYVRFRVNDSAGNNYPSPTSAVTSDNVSIDKEIQEITFESPSDGGEASGIVTLQAFIDDSNGVGLKDVNYSLVNKSTGSVFRSGDLNASNDWDTTWNSSADVPNFQQITFKITAEDLLGNRRSENITFRVANGATTNTITAPAPTYVPADFDLLITAKRAGPPHLVNHTYFIFNESTGTVVNSSQVTGLDISEHSFNFSVDTGSWPNDGNYTINSSAFDNESVRATARSWFYLDRVDPQADTSGVANRSWQRGIIDVGYTALDAVKNGSCYWRFNDEGSWSSNNSLSCGTGTFRFDTSNCNDDSAADCRVQVIAEDEAGNLQRDSVYLKVDNSPPNVSFIAPPSASWQDGDFEVKRNDEDSTVAQSLLTCQWRNGSGSWIDVSGACDGNFTVDISTYCSQEGDTECEIEIRTRNPAGATVRKTRRFSIDTRPPNVKSVEPLPSNEPIINGSRNFTIRFNDPSPGSGIQYAVRNNGTHREALSSGVEFDPGWEDNGQETLSFALNDSADNLVTRQYTFEVDVSPPQAMLPRFNVTYDTAFGGYRIYPGQPITFKVNVTDNYETDTVTATLNTSSNGINGENISLTQTVGNYSDGVWEFTYTETGAVGTYNLTALYMSDAVENRNVTTDLPSFKVVKYDFNASVGGNRRIAAGHEEQAVLNLDLNRTLTDPLVRVFVPPSNYQDLAAPAYANTSAFTCTFGTASCSVVDVSSVGGDVAAFTVRGNGTASSMTVSGDVRADTPSFDTDRRWRIRIKGFQRKNRTTTLAPDLEVTTVGCDGACRTNQSASINLSVTVANFNTSSSSGVANDTAVNVTNTSLGLLEQGATGDIPTGNSSAVNISVTVGEAGNFTLDVTAFDRFTGAYRDTAQLDLHVVDITPPNSSAFRIVTKNVYINDTVPIEVDAMDNIGVGAINVTLRNATGALVNATMERKSGTAADGTWRADFNRTQVEGFYNVTKLFVHDTYGNLNVTNVSGAFEVGRLSTTIDASPQSTSIDDNVVIGVNVSGNITRTTSVVANITKPRSYVETVEVKRAPTRESEYAVVYGNTSRSGSYDVNVSVIAGVTVSNMTQNLFAIDFGQLAAEPLSGNGTHLTLPLDASPYQLSWSITPDTGDLIDVWANASVNNTSVIELQDATPGRDVGNVTYEEGDARVTYGMNGREVGSTVFNLSVNASNGDQQLYVPINVTVVGEDTQAPNITSYDESPTELNKNQPVTITATVDDNSIIKNLTLVVQHPVNGSNYTEAPVAMEQVDRGTYRYRFTNTSETGHYTYRIRAWDIALNNDTIHSNSFDVKEQFSVNVTSVRRLFKKADTGRFDITVRDVNGDIIEGYDTTVILNKAGTNVTLFRGGFKSRSTYTFKRSDPPSPAASEVPKQYTLYVNVSKQGNTGRTAYTFNVTRLLDVTFIDPNQGDTVAPGSEFQLRVNITGPNGEIVEGIMYARCEQCPSQYKFLDFAGGGLFVQNFTAPQDEDSALIRVFASDLQGNTESQDSGPLSAAPAITIQVGNETAVGPGGGGGGGGGGGFGTRFQIEKQSPQQVSLPSNTSTVNLSVSTNLAAACRYTNRSLSIVRVDAMNRFNRTGGTLHWSVVATQPGRTYRYNILCQQATGGNATLEVVFSIEPETVASFGLFIPSTLPPDGSGVEQGSVGEAPFSIYNNGSESIQIEVGAVVQQCCSAWVSNESGRVDTVTLTPGSEKSLTLNVDVPLNTSLGAYTVGLSFASGGRVREKTLRMTVVKGQGIKRLESLKQRAQQILQQIRNYRRSGINTTGLMQDYQRLQQLIDYAEQAVAQDDRQVFANVLEQAETKADEIEGRLRALAFKNYVLENWWKWLFGGIAVYTLFFLLTMVVVPYYRLRTDYLTVKEKLESATQARKKAERQYFKRQIDRDTFMDIMTERQDEILELRSERDELEEKLDTAIQRRLSLENYLKAPIKAVREINRWIESRRNKMVAEHESSE